MIVRNYAGRTDDHRRATAGGYSPETKICDHCGQKFDANEGIYKPFGKHDGFTACSVTCNELAIIDDAIENLIDSRWEGAD